MRKDRVLAFSEAIIAILMTIMVLEIKVPEVPHFSALLREYPYFIAFIVSFLIISVSWYNQHYIFAKTKWVSRRAFWANLLWLLVMAFFPVATARVSEFPNDRDPSYFYFGIYFCWMVAYYLLAAVLVADNDNHQLAQAISPKKHFGLDIPLLLIGMVGIYFWPPMCLVITSLLSVSYAVLVPRDSDRIETE
ncbi:TMEM175 family protein [Levilactobacillus bambusae]|uniref:DUF1211 domain-containing protein n=1 Tax=Levilactobacillus bambusae TaxID=2024736 RepID=A0A2V1N068_9LACO|nr:TMEM175 family protein [Levilactobacillus bambusae]PWG00462.1 hypothetical protein DCM90_05930 [Levilactobacillus bambusae]